MEKSQNIHHFKSTVLIQNVRHFFFPFHIVLCISILEYSSYLTMLSEEEEYTSKTKQPKTKRKTTKKSSSEKKKKKCNCRSGCSKRSCYCFKTSSGCDSTCGCGPSCQNLFNHFDYFFGEDSKCTANACFSDWLVKTAKTADELQKIDRQALVQKIINCGR